MRLTMFRIVLALLICSSSSLYAGSAIVYSSLNSAKIYLQDTPHLGKNTFLAKFVGISSKWENKIIMLEKIVKDNAGSRYSFTYTLELSSGKHTKSYEMMIETGNTLKNGGLVPTLDLYFPEMPNNKPQAFYYDEKLSQQMPAVDLAKDFSKATYSSPEVD